jgi:hypothetical protein
MIKGFERPQPAEPESINHWQAVAAIASGMIAGAVLFVVPHGSPWGKLTVFTPTILGRVVPATWHVSAFSAIGLHLLLSVVYGFVISLSVVRLREMRAVLVGGLVGLVLYALNLGIVTMWLPGMRGNEVSVVITHAVFGLIAAGAYRGLLRRNVPA